MAKDTSSARTKKDNFFDENQEDDFSSYFKKKASYKETSPFDDEDSPEKATWNAGKPGKQGVPYGDVHEEKLQTPREMYQQEVQKIQDRTLNMTTKSLLLIDESEAVGTAAAQELIAQREQLDRTNKNLDEMNTTLDQSQKHLNNIRSIFGGIKNWWTSKPAESPKPVPSSSTNSLRSVVDSSPYAAAEAQKAAVNISAEAAWSANTTTAAPPRIPAQPASSRQFEKALDTNLDQMSLGLSRLKGLAQGLGTEIEQQNKLLEDMTTKTDHVSGKMGGQQKSIDKILGKKK